jgi:integrase
MPENFRIGRFFLQRRRNSPAWCACWFDAESRQTRRSSLGTGDLQEAKVRLAEFVTKNETLKDAKPSDVLLEAVLIRYWEGHAKHIASAEQARIALALWSDHLAECTVAELTPQRQEKFIAALRAKGYKASYISRVLSVGRAALSWAWKRGELVSVPFVADVSRDLEEEAERFRDLEMEEVARLLAAAVRVPHLLTFCMVALITMARPDAVLDLGPSQVDLRRRLIALNPKGRKQTEKYRPVVPISETLQPWVSTCANSHFVMFGGRPVGDIKKSFARAVEEAGLSGVSAYCLRSTMATELRTRGVPEWEVGGMLGHKSATARTTERYAKFRPNYLGEAVRAIDAYFSELLSDFGQLLADRAFDPLRASCVLVPEVSSAQVLDFMVGGTGIEPVTPTMST